MLRIEAIFQILSTLVDSRSNKDTKRSQKRIVESDNLLVS